MEFHTWLQTNLNDRGWSQSDLARAMDTRPSAISKWVNGHQKPEIAQCVRMAQALHLPKGIVCRLAGHDPYWTNGQSHTSVDDTLRPEINELANSLPKDLLRPVVVMLRALAEEYEGGNA
jgi:transcriptional regulator with XRE-family HTH domain